MAPGIGGGFEAVIPLLHFDHHHFNGDNGIIHQQPQGEDQRAEGDAVEVLPVAAITTNTTARVSGTAAATTTPTRQPMLTKHTAITTNRATKI